MVSSGVGYPGGRVLGVGYQGDRVSRGKQAARILLECFLLLQLSFPFILCSLFNLSIKG